jgi:demethylmenaquinone methyltransferase / 2-methoxy-6-polyprenyl-1,4-benzoquinol methylase
MAEAKTPEDAVRMSGESKKAFIKNLFDSIACKYDYMNNLISAGGTTRWRKYALGKLNMPQGASVLDVGTGTGWLPIYLADKRNDLDVTGFDISEGMLKIAREKCPTAKFLTADATAMPFPDCSFDLVMSAFVIRNLQDSEAAVTEMARVVKSGGRVLILGTFSPKGIAAPFMRWWLRKVVPRLAVKEAREHYRYLAASIIRLDKRQEIADLLERCGCEIEFASDIELGTVHMIIARKR